MNGWHCQTTHTRLWHCYADVHSHNLFPLAESHSSRPDTKCCCDWQLLLTYVGEGGGCVCVAREGVCVCGGGGGGSWINDVLEQVHKWEAQCLFPRTMWYWSTSSEQDSGASEALMSHRLHRTRLCMIPLGRTSPPGELHVSCFPSGFMNINSEKLASSVSSPGPGAKEVTPGHLYILMSCRMVIDWPHHWLAYITLDCHSCIFIIWRERGRGRMRRRRRCQWMDWRCTLGYVCSLVIDEASWILSQSELLSYVLSNAAAAQL